MQKTNPRIQAMQEIADKFSNSYEAIAFLREPKDALGGKTPADFILDNRAESVYTLLDSEDFDGGE